METKIKTTPGDAAVASPIETLPVVTIVAPPESSSRLFPVASLEKIRKMIATLPVFANPKEKSSLDQLDAVAAAMQVGKVEVLIQQGKLKEADVLAESIKQNFFVNLTAEQRKFLQSSPKIRARVIEAVIFQAEIAERKGEHGKAVERHQDMLKHIDALLKAHPECVEAHLLSAKVRHFLGDYTGALKAYQALAKASPEDAGYLQVYRLDLGALANQTNTVWKLRELMGEPAAALALLSEEIKLRSALGDSAAIGSLSARAEKLAPSAQSAIFKLQLDSNRKLALSSTDPDKKLFYQGKVLLLEDQLPAARAKWTQFKAATGNSKDPEIAAMRLEAGAVLRKFDSAALQRLSHWNQALLGQRSSSLVSVAATIVDSNLNGSPRMNQRLLEAAKFYLDSGKADTIEEAFACLSKDYVQLQLDFAKRPVIPAGQKLSYSYFVMAGPNPPTTEQTLTLAGGLLDMGEAINSDTKYPKSLRVVIGPEGGCIKTFERTYLFPPGKEVRTVTISNGHLKAGALKEAVIHPETLAQPAGDFKSIGYSHEPDYLHYNSDGFDPKDPESLRLLIDHAAKIGSRDPDFAMLLKLETSEGLEASKTDAGRGELFLAAAKQVRHRTGSYLVASELLEAVFARDLAKAIAELEPDAVKKIRNAAEADKPAVEKRVREELKKWQEKHPSEFSERFPKGAGEAEIQAMVQQSLQGKIAIQIRKLAFAKLDQWESQAQMSDPLAAEAWRIYEDMKDPLDKTWNLADESWDGIVDEVVITAVTMPIAMGAGAALRTTLGSTSLALRWAAQGGVRALAIKGGIMLASAGVEGLSMESMTPGEFEWKRVGFNVLMLTAFHGGGKLWGGAAQKLGIGEAAMLALKSEGKSVAGKAALNFGGGILTQAGVATGMSYVGEVALGHDNPTAFWERCGGELLRMLAFHYGTESFHGATGKILVDGDLANRTRFKEAEQSYQKWLETGLPADQALSKAVEYAKALKIDATTGSASIDVKAEDVTELSDAKQKSAATAKVVPPPPVKKAAPAAALNVAVKMKADPKPVSVVQPVVAPNKAKPEVADANTMKLAAGKFAESLDARIERWQGEQTAGVAVSRETLIQEQCALALEIAESFGLKDRDRFQKRITELIDRRLQAADEAPRTVPDALRFEPGEIAAVAPVSASSRLPMERIVADVERLAQRYSGDRMAFKKELARVIVMACHTFQAWAGGEAPGAFQISTEVQGVSHAFAQEIAKIFSLGGDPALVKAIESAMRDRIKDALRPEGIPTATSIRPPAIAGGDALHLEPTPVQSIFSKMQRATLDMLMLARGEFESPADGKAKLASKKYQPKWAVKPVYGASEKLDQVFAILADEMTAKASSEIAEAAEAIGKDIDILTKDDPERLAPEFDTEIRKEKEAALDRLENLLRGFNLKNFSWEAHEIAREYQKLLVADEKLPVLGLIDGRAVGLGIAADSPWMIDLTDASQVYLKNSETGDRISFYAASEKLIYPELVKGARVAWSAMVGGGSVGKPAAHAQLHLKPADFAGTLPPLEPHPDAGSFRIGRDAGSAGLDVSIDNHRISSVHAVIRSERDAQGNVVWWLRDGGFDPKTGAAKPSTNGVWLDGQRVEGEVRIYPGQKIQIDILPFTFSPQPGGNYHAAALSVMPKLQFPVAQPVAETKSILDVHRLGEPRHGILESLVAGLDYGSYSAATHEGIAKRPGEANALVNEDGLVQGANWALVLDGMGGMGGGDQASKIAGESFADFMVQYSSAGDPTEIFRHAFKTAGDAVNASPYRHGGAVAVGHWIVRNPDGSYKAVLGHVGDARAFVLSNGGELKHATLDQSPVAFKYQPLGSPSSPDAATELKMRADPNSNIVFGGLGTGHEADPVMTELALKPGDRIVMVSDGVSDNVSSTEIASIVASSATAGEAQRRIFAAAFEKMQDWSDVRQELKNSSKERLPITALDGRTLWIDRYDNLWDQNAGGQLVDHYKPDNLTVHVYFHDLAKA